MARRRDGQGAVYTELTDAGKRNSDWPVVGVNPVYGQTRSEVLRRLREARWLLAQGLPVSSRKVTLGLFLAGWLELIRGRVRPSTYESYELNVRRINEHLGALSLIQLAAPDIQATYRRLHDRGLTDYSVRQVHSLLDRALRHAIQCGLISRNPAALVFSPRPRRREMTALSAEQLMRLLEHALGQRLQPLLVILGTAGLRIGEALGLRWRDVDLNAGRLVVRQALQRRRGAGLVFVEPKTARSRRTVHLAAIGIGALLEQSLWQSQQSQQWANWKESGLVFTSLSGGPLEPGVVNETLSRLLLEAELPHVRVHDLRRTKASTVLEAGVHPKLVQDLLGHRTIAVPLDTYSHVIPALHGQAVRELQRLLVRARPAVATVSTFAP